MKLFLRSLLNQPTDVDTIVLPALSLKAFSTVLVSTAFEYGYKIHQQALIGASPNMILQPEAALGLWQPTIPLLFELEQSIWTVSRHK